MHGFPVAGLALIILFQGISSIATDAQDGTNQSIIHVTGRTYDMDSLEVLPFVALTVDDDMGLISDQNGYFALDLTVGDTLAFSHVGYLISTLVLSEVNYQNDTLYLEIFMERQAYELPEVTIFPYRDYEAFKHAFMQLESDEVNGDNFSKNIELLLLQLNSGYIPDKDSYSVYRNMMMMKDQNNNSFIFISSEPGKGIYPFLQKLFTGELFE